MQMMPDAEPSRNCRSTHCFCVVAFFVLLLGATRPASGSTLSSDLYEKNIQPLLEKYCYDCHGDGASKGKVSFDTFKSHQEMLGRRDLWLAVLKNVRAGIMPPEKKDRPTADELRVLENWIKGDVFQIDPENPDPGRVTLRRLNREEYRNTVRDLMGFDYKVQDELPPDDTGYGFDNIGDVLTTSPMLLEKYMQAAETIVAGAVPRVGRVIADRTFNGNSFRNADEKRKGDRHSFYDETKLTRGFKVEHPGSYRVALEFDILGQFDFDPGRVKAVFKIDDREVWTEEIGWQNGKKFRHVFDQKWSPGDHRVALELQPLTPVEKKKNSLDFRLLNVRVEGPTEKEHWVRPKNFDLFFTKDVPEGKSARRQYAREILDRFATRAFRRPVDRKTVDRLMSIAESTWTEKGKRFEDGVAQAMIPVLASPRFLFRTEESEPLASSRRREEADGAGDSANPPPHVGGYKSQLQHPLVDEYALASRLSYFLWSTMPDAELFQLAAQRELRKNLDAQVKRMLAHERSEAFIENFIGQWLQVRDVEGIDINTFVVLGRDRGQENEFRRTRARLEELRAKPSLTLEEEKEREQILESRRKRFANRQMIELDGELRRALRRETEMAFSYVMRENRSVLELLDADYTFLNERLARHYGLTNLNIKGGEMRKVSLTKDTPRGGILTHGSVLIVTSNPTRTSPVKRGLFVLENILGMPPPPPPADVPLLEDSEKEVAGRSPTLRETLAIHREKPLCSSCHNRMDPLGLALENFNALGMWRETERGQPIDAAGKLITGETFKDIRDVKKVLVANHQSAFYECLTEKLLTYALGRGLQYYDTETLDQIVHRLEGSNGKFSALLTGIIESAPFQKRRNPSAPADAPAPAVAPKQPEQRADTKR